MNRAGQGGDDHMFVAMPGFWSPWECVCGAGGTGADEENAENQYLLHTLGVWPAFIEPVGEYTQAFVTPWGAVCWVRPD